MKVHIIMGWTNGSYAGQNELYLIFINYSMAWDIKSGVSHQDKEEN